MKPAHSVRSHHAAFWGLKFDSVANFNENVRISPGTISEAVVGRLGDLLEASRSHFLGSWRPFEGFMGPSWKSLEGPWAAKTIFERF